MDRYEEMEDLRRKWVPPAGLAGAVPRPVRLAAAGVALVVLAAVMFAGAVAVVVGLGAAARNQSEEHVRLRDHGQDSEARITRHWRDSTKEHRPMVAYEFEWEGRTHAGRSPLPLRMWNTLAVGSPLAVRLLPENPRHNRPRDWEASPLPAWFPFVAGGVLAGAGWLLVYLVRKQMRLLSEGRPAPGLVRRYSYAQHGKKHIHYEFCLLGGGIAKGKTGPSRKLPAIGATICVVYERDNPRNNAPYPMDLVKLA
ncbi:conserved hypothetical protein [Candidatus Sulfopaludibacter sp. SbA4]|nr:conserved hypothetical protein [Candidatus Sulfopaludibacter sp. SbA4]